MLCCLAFFLLLFLLGCASPQTVNHAQLEQLKTHWQEPKLTMWCYTLAAKMVSTIFITKT